MVAVGQCCVTGTRLAICQTDPRQDRQMEGWYEVENIGKQTDRLVEQPTDRQTDRLVEQPTDR